MPEHVGGLIPYYMMLTFMVAEAAFFPYYLYLFIEMHDADPKLEHFANCKRSRMKLAVTCVEALSLSARPGSANDIAPELYLRKVIEGWFFEHPIADIRLLNFADWCAWAFFNEHYDAMDSREQKECLKIVDYFGTKAQWRFEAGKNENLRPARINLDPMFVTQRPFMFYASVGLINFSAHLVLNYLGFKQQKKYSCSGQNLYYRPATVSKKNMKSHNSNGGGQDQDQNDYSAPAKLPIVFIHGIGIGFAHYLGLIANFPKDTDVFLLEWPHVCMQMVKEGPKIKDTVDILCDALDDFGHPSAVFVAHSLGTTAVSWMLHDPRGCTKVARTVLLDPVTFLLCDPRVATVFVYNNPTNTVDFLMHFFLSRELFISNALSRHFNWSHNIMFAEDFLHASNIGSSHDSDEYPLDNDFISHTVILSSLDSIVPVGPVSRYLEAKQDEFRARGHNCFEVCMFHGNHGEMLVHPSWVNTIARKVEERCQPRPEQYDVGLNYDD